MKINLPSAGLGATVCLRPWRWLFNTVRQTTADNNPQLGKLGGKLDIVVDRSDGSLPRSDHQSGPTTARCRDVAGNILAGNVRLAVLAAE